MSNQANVDKIKRQGDALFSGRSQLMSLWQEIADNFYPERADFTTSRSLGEEFADNLDTSYPVLARRDLGNQIGGMLRPTSKDWFSMRKNYDEESLDHEGKAWLEWATKLQKRAMYDPIAMFTRATKEADHDWAAFGQCVLSRQINLRTNTLLYRCWHLRDVAWQEDEIGRVGTVFRKWKPTAVALSRMFGKGKLGVHRRVTEALSKEPYKEFNVWHLEIPSDTYDGDWKTPLVSIFFDVDNKHIMEEVGVLDSDYIIPRWQTVSGSQYAFSPATVTALPDARLIQTIARVLLDAGEKAIDPPMLAVQETIRGDVSIYAGGITWVDAEYDGKLDQVLREMKQGGSLPVGFELSGETRSMIADAFYLNKLTLPPPDREMTAYEAGQRVQEYIRQALPIFEPMEVEYNGQICESTFALLMRMGVFGSPSQIPKSLQGQDVKFKFESPLRDTVEAAKGHIFAQTKDLLTSAMELDQATRHVLDPTTALRDALTGIGTPVRWQRSPEEAAKLAESDQQAEQTQQDLMGAQQAADVVNKIAPSMMQGEQGV